ncbi:hypothetical protein LXL04_001734 [Taraxacum kok-saghyz]
MASSSGTTTSSGNSYLIQTSGSEEDLQLLMKERKRKRMISNRESARRSRKRKQKHIDDLTSHLNQLRVKNNQIISSVSITTQHYMSVEAENSVLRAQVAELSHRLQSLNEMIALMYQPLDAVCGFSDEQYRGGGDTGNDTEFVDEFMNNSLSYRTGSGTEFVDDTESEVNLLKVLEKNSDLEVICVQKENEDYDDFWYKEL